jgi:YHS domain-containing protein
MSVKDPVCGMPLDPSKTQFTTNFLSRQYYFDSEYCMYGFIEGAKIVFPDSWVLIRAANTSPILCLSIEARDQKRPDELKTEMIKLIKSVNA